MLGEGWDARCVSGVIDLTTPTTHQSAVQVRGRSLRTDPAWPDKVAVNWTPVCVAPDHPRGAQDWERLVEKLDGYVAPLAIGRLGVGAGCVGWLPEMSTGQHPVPPEGQFSVLNAASRRRAAGHAAIRQAWGAGDAPRGAGQRSTASTGSLRGYVTHRTVELPPPGTRVAPRVAPAFPGPGPDVEVGAFAANGLGIAMVAGIVPAVAFGYVEVMMVGAGAVGVVGGTVIGMARRASRRRRLRTSAEEVLAHARRRPGLQHVAGAVAEALHELGILPVGADVAELIVAPDGSYVTNLRGAGPEHQELFAAAVREVVGPLGAARFVIAVPILSPSGEAGDASRIRTILAGRVVPHDDEAWFAVPSVLGDDADRAATYAACWARWTGGRATALDVETPEGAGVLAAHAD